MADAEVQRSVRVPPAVRVAGGLVGSGAAAVASWGGVLLVVQGRVVPGWGVGAGLLVLACAPAWVRRRATASRIPRERGTWERVGRRLLLVVAVLGVAWGAADDVLSGAEYHVLRPAGPDGCTAVVRETSFLVIGNGEAYAVGRTGLALGESGSWTVDDGYRPVRAGSYELHWGPDGGRLRISGTSTDPVLQGGGADIDCGW
ncbi:hypothetical protein ACIP2X_35920 [Streptomyces sp. NPDC089424]|uniref:hypothetical protein n=1 Tax=Streptomyces sp. NPDC089424 TaxID=3365917 RepID=UPI00382B598D